ncbi:chitinase-like protein PB1E7.04c isoform X2 [Drosophila teissieri]|uniref:chitinase-like protein PB1E7.04c isoform X2 n=1 Tax=Drosophila teissieri TaxID=7243 RepID=UPI001CBA3E1A|nr:chitinase-like protein PB1E7.04c isoform X2 [Drosophila teissieri]
MGAKQTLTEGVVLGLGSIKRIGTWPTITSKLLFPANRQTMPAQITLKLLLLLLISKWALGQSDCSDCSSTNGQYACVNETAYGFCFDQGTVDEDAVQNCRDGYYCVLEGFCAPMASAEPACITVTSTSTTDIVTDSSTLETTESTVTTTAETSDSTMTETTTSSFTTDSTTSEFSTDSSTDSTTSEMTTESITDSTTSELTTESTSDSTTSETTTESSTDSTTSELTTDSSTDSTTTTAETTSDSSTDSSTSELTTESSTDSTTSELTTDSSTDSTTSATSTDSSTQTTVPSEIDPNAYCAKLKSKGYFRVENDTTCQMYVYCYKLSLDYLGWLYYCNTNEYYNSDTEACQSTRPSNC